MKSHKVIILKPGYSTPVGPGQMRADGTITLVTGPKKIIVDTGGPWDRLTIFRALAKEEVHARDIDVVVCTHGHSDHTGNNNLFPAARLIVGYDVSERDLYTAHDFVAGQPYKISDYVEVLPTPGHTNQSVSVIVKTTKGVVAIVGDLFENEQDLKDESLWRATSLFPEEQLKNRKKILEMADFIVPGHGPMFPVKK
jgi:glyoxylase-like metal-dependent hydrolase (beta-lactamase superfamily II)